MKVKIKILSSNVDIPKMATQKSVGVDLCSTSTIEIKSTQKVLVGTGIAVEIPKNFGGFIFSRSGLSLNHEIILINGVGIIDSDYTGEIKIPLYNISEVPYTIERGERIAQLVIIKHENIEFVICNELNFTARGNLGFGSTGKI